MTKRKLFALLFLAASVPARATPWVDDIGRSTSMSYPGASPLNLRPNGHNLVQGADTFKKLCLATGFDKAAVGAAAQAIGWGFAYRAQMMPFKTPVDIGGWESTDAAVYAANGIFFNKLPQCNLTFVPSTPATLADVQAALSAALGQAPANADKAVGKNGKVNRRYEPEWRLVQPDGSIHIVFARLSPTVRGAVHLAVLKKAPK